MTYRAFNVSRKEYIEGEFFRVAEWLAALVCNDAHSAMVGRWAGDRIVVQAEDARAGSQCYVNRDKIKQYTNITPHGGLIEV